MAVKPFDEKELTVVGEIPGFFGGPATPLYDFPITRKEMAKKFHYDHEAWWLPMFSETGFFCPSCIPDNIARAFVYESKPYDRSLYGGKDMFGVEWVFVPVAGGSMVKPGSPLLTDANEWKEKVIFPDIESWDWEGNAAMNKEYLDNMASPILWFLNGCWFERMISFFDFEGAAEALIDDEQIDAVKELLHATTDLYIKIFDKCCEVYPQIDIYNIHDDWGSQGAPFFSEATARDVFLPEMKRFVDHVHAAGKAIDLHSCGHIEDRCGVFVDAGFDSWAPMTMNDTQALYEKYGDKIIISVVADNYDLENKTEEEQRACARDFCNRFVQPGKYCKLNTAGNKITPAFREELYKQSRINLSK